MITPSGIEWNIVACLARQRARPRPRSDDNAVGSDRNSGRVQLDFVAAKL